MAFDVFMPKTRIIHISGRLQIRTTTTKYSDHKFSAMRHSIVPDDDETN